MPMTDHTVTVRRVTISPWATSTTWAEMFEEAGKWLRENPDFEISEASLWHGTSDDWDGRSLTLEAQM